MTAPRKDAIINQLKELGGQAEFIAQVYYDRGVEQTEANRDRIEKLYRLGILRPYLPDTPRFALTRELRGLFDRLTASQRLSAATPELASLVERLGSYSRMYQDARREQRHDDAERHCEDAFIAVGEAAASIDELLTQVQYRLSGGFSDVESLSEKREKNDWFLKELHRLVAAMDGLSQSLLVGDFTELADFAALVANAARWIPEKYTRLQSTTDQLSRDLFRYRETDHRDRLLLTFRQHLHRHPGFTPDDLLDRHLEGPSGSLFTRAPNASVQTRVDINDRRVADGLADMARALSRSAPERPTPEPETRGDYQESGTQSRQTAPSPQQVWVSQCLLEALETPSLSLAHYRERALKALASRPDVREAFSQAEVQWLREAPRDIWMLCVINTVRGTRKWSRRLTLEYCYHPSRPADLAAFDNEWVSDVVLKRVGR